MCAGRDASKPASPKRVGVVLGLAARPSVEADARHDEPGMFLGVATAAVRPESLVGHGETPGRTLARRIGFPAVRPERIGFPASGPNALLATLRLPPSGPNAIDATLGSPLSGPNALLATLRLPPSGPNAVNATLPTLVSPL